MIKSMSTTTLPNRRQDFRVETQIKLNRTPFNPEQRENLRRDYFSQRNEQIRSHEQDRLIASAIRRIEPRYPDLADLFIHFYEKLARQQRELIERITVLEQQAQPASPHTATDSLEPLAINLSRGGLALFFDEPLPVGSEWLLDITLLPSNQQFKVTAQVIYQLHQPDSPLGSWRMGLEFNYLYEDDERIITQHVMQAQQEQLARRQEQ